MIKFYKMHGLGNDYIYIDCFGQDIPNPGEFAKVYSDRNFGIGSDGLVLIKPSKVANCNMEMYNSDGTQGNMCGNAIRCVGKYMYDQGKIDSTKITVETKSGIKTLDLFVEKNMVQSVKVDMGEPEFAPLEYYEIEGIRMYLVSMGNPHAVVVLDNIEDFDLEKWGKFFQTHEKFPNGINLEIVQVLNDKKIKMEVWERGTGRTLACGTGACASLVICSKLGKTKNVATVCLPGGDLDINWSDENNHVYMTGSATSVYWGYIDDNK